MLEIATDETGHVRLSPFGGLFYQGCLRLVHRHLRPRSYLQVGDETAETLQMATCPAIAIDPGLHLGGLGEKPRLHLYRMTSDAFFTAHDPQRILGRAVDLAYLDGLHLSEVLLRDFINAERNAAPDGMIILHDCVPLDPFMALRDPDEGRQRASQQGWWTGDVWKTVAVLGRHRPDLRIVAYDAPPTGLVLVTQLDPHSRRLGASYRGLVAEMQALDSRDDYKRYLEWLSPDSTDGLEGALAASVAA
jgi:hypothetical protein